MTDEVQNDRKLKSGMTGNKPQNVSVLVSASNEKEVTTFIVTS